MIGAKLIETAHLEAPTGPEVCDDQRIDLAGLMTSAERAGNYLASREAVGHSLGILAACGLGETTTQDVLAIQSTAAWAQGFMAGVWAARREAEERSC